MTAYQMEVNNIANYMKEFRGKTELDAFICSSVLAIAHCKSKEEVLMDIIDAGDVGDVCESCEGSGFLLSNKDTVGIEGYFEIQRCDDCCKYKNDSSANQAVFDLAKKKLEENK
jgi:hypothetical protein